MSIDRESFKKKFGLPKNNFSEPIDITNVEIGFSVYNDHGRPHKGFKSLFRVYINKFDLDNKEFEKPITITASYGKASEEGLITFSSEFKRKDNWPVDLISENEFFYNIETEEFFDKSENKNEEIEGLDILIKIDNLHLKPTRRIKGFPFRFKLKFFHFIAFIFKAIFYLLSVIQYLISGKKVSIFGRITELANSLYIRERSPAIKESGMIDIFGYKVKPWIAVMYSLIHLSTYLICNKYNYRPVWLITIFTNNFLTLVYGIISLGITNSLLPRILKPITFLNLLKIIQSQYIKYISKKIKI